jgi:GNAT superfamily N-acetyltransferase
MTIAIRPLVAADRAIWQPLWKGYLDFYETVLPQATYDLTFARLTGGKEPMGGMLSFDETGQARGLVHWVQHRTCWGEKDNCYLQDLFSDPSVRGKGHGRALIEAVYAKAADLGCSRVYWQTHETNMTAQALYDRIADKSGFIVYRKAIG